MSSFAIPVTTHMSAPVHMTLPSERLDRVHKQLISLSISSLPVVDERGRLVGVVSRSDLLRMGRFQAGLRHSATLLTFPDRPVADVMTANVVTVGPEASLSEAASLMARKNIHRVFVMDGDSLMGVLSTKDVMAAIRDTRMANPISEYMSHPVFTVHARDTVELASARLDKARISGLVVVDDDWPIGVFTQSQALAARDLPRETPVEDAMDAAMVCMPSDTKMYRAAAQASAMRVRRIIVAKQREMVGILSGLDFAKAIAL